MPVLRDLPVVDLEVVHRAGVAHRDPTVRAFPGERPHLLQCRRGRPGVVDHEHDADAVAEQGEHHAEAIGVEEQPDRVAAPRGVGLDVGHREVLPDERALESGPEQVAEGAVTAVRGDDPAEAGRLLPVGALQDDRDPVVVLAECGERDALAHRDPELRRPLP